MTINFILLYFNNGINSKKPSPQIVKIHVLQYNFKFDYKIIIARSACSLERPIFIVCVKKIDYKVTFRIKNWSKQ